MDALWKIMFIIIETIEVSMIIFWTCYMYIAYIIYYCICFPLCAHILYFDAAKLSIKLF